MSTRSTLTTALVTALTTAAAIAATAVSVPAASAHEAGSHAEPSVAGRSPYAEPLETLDGQTLAQVLADHNEARLARQLR